MTHETVTQSTGMSENAHPGKQDTEKSDEKCDITPEIAISRLIFITLADKSRKLRQAVNVAVTAISKWMKAMCDFAAVHRYIQEKLGRPVFTHELAAENVLNEIKEKTKSDFLSLCGAGDGDEPEV